jgi:O-antigen/teichoic acid export membrane protein
MIARNVIITFVTQLGVVAVNFVTGILLARLLSPGERGILALIMTLPPLIYNLANLGLHEGSVYFIRREGQIPGFILSQQLMLSAIPAVLLAGILLACKPLILPRLPAGFPPALWNPVSLLPSLYLLQMVVLSIAWARQQFIRISGWYLSGAAALLICFSIALLGFNARLETVAFVYVGVTTMVAASSFVWVGRLSGWTIRPDFPLQARLARYGLKSYAQIFFQSLNYRVDVLILAMLADPAQVAFYGVAVNFAETAWYLPEVVSNVLFPALAGAHPKEVHPFAARALRITIAATLPVIGGLLALGGWFLPKLYGAPYQAAVVPLILLLPGVLAIAIYKIISRDFASLNRQGLTAVASAAAFILILGLDLALIPGYGAVGAALASSIGYILAGGMQLFFFRQQSCLPMRQMLIINREDVGDLWRVLRRTIGKDPDPSAATHTPPPAPNETKEMDPP